MMASARIPEPSGPTEHEADDVSAPRPGQPRPAVRSSGLRAWLVPGWIRGYRRTWLSRDVVAGATLAAVAIPETMGYTSIAHTPVVTGLYTVLLPTAVFALLGSSRLLVVGADSATAAILAAGLASLGVAGLTPNSQEWLAWCGLVALVCAGLLLLARVFRLGFLGDFLSASVLVGFLTGVGVQVFSGQIPAMLGVPTAAGNWFQQQWGMLSSIPDLNGPTLALSVGTLAIIVGLRRFAPQIPGAIVAVVLAILAVDLLDLGAHGVTLIGEVPGGPPPLGLPPGVTWSDAVKVIGIASSCCVLIIAQSAATSRSFAMKHGQRVDVNRDILGLSGASLAAGLSGTFVVNGSPTKTQVLDEQKGRTQLANLVMSGVVLIVVLFATGLLADMPKAVLAAIVFLIGIDLVDVAGLRLIRKERLSEFIIAAVTGAAVVVVGVEQGIVLAVVLSILEIIRRQYRPADFVVTVHSHGDRTYRRAAPGVQSEPGLVAFRYSAELFYANANRFVDDVQEVVEGTPDPLQWLVLDCSAISDIDYSAGVSLAGLVDWVHSRGAVFAIAGADTALLGSLTSYGVLGRIGPEHVYSSLAEMAAAFLRAHGPEPKPRGAEPVIRPG